MEGTQAATTGAGEAVAESPSTTERASFTGKLLATGGTGAQAGGAGTAFTGVAGAGGNLVIDNGSNTKAATTPLPPGEDFSNDDVTIQNGATVVLLGDKNIGSVDPSATTITLATLAMWMPNDRGFNPDFGEWNLVSWSDQAAGVATIEWIKAPASTVPDGTAWVPVTTFAGLQVNSGAILEQDQSNGPAPLDVAVTGDLVVAAGGSILADGMGEWPGAGQGKGNNGTGGGYGGDGGNNLSGLLGGTEYGSVHNPVDFGSGGGSPAGGTGGTGGAGGGAIDLTVGGALTVGGTLSANGDAGLGNGGGGSGGSILVTVGGLFTGAGNIQANGGNAGSNNGGGGSGGRIAIHYGTSSFTGKLLATGGTGAQAGGAGTAFTGVAGAGGNLVIDNGSNTKAATTPLPPGQDFSNDDVTVQNGATVVLLPQTDTSIGSVNPSATTITLRHTRPVDAQRHGLHPRHRRVELGLMV